MKYPPFCDIIVINFNGQKENEIQKASSFVYQYLRKNLSKDKFKTFKPMPSPIDKIQNRIRWRIIIKGNATPEARQIINQCLAKTYESNWKDIRVSADVNPSNMM